MISKSRARNGLLAGLAAVLLFVAGCGSENGSSGDKAGTESATTGYNNEPVTVKIYSHNAGINTDQDLEDLFIKPVKAKYPNITIEQIKGVKLDQAIASGDIPDIIATSNYYLYDLLELGLGSDLSEVVKKMKIDLNKIEPAALTEMKSFGKNGELFGVPYSMNYGVLLVNKDIFDKFGVTYPKDEMTWNQVIDLAKKVTRTDGDAQYIGLDPGSAQLLIRTYSLPVVDEKQEKAVLTTDKYKKVFGMLREIYDIPGFVDKNKKYSYGFDYFAKDKKLAMLPYWLAALQSRLPQLNEQGQGMKWDIVSYPMFDDRPGIGREVDFHLAMVPPTAKNKEAAYAVIQTLMSDEAQIAMNKGSRLTILNDQKLRLQYASGTNGFEGKNLEGIFKVKPAPAPPATIYQSGIYNLLSDAGKSMAQQNVDINTALRTANEKADKLIQDKKAEMSK